jgi:hypothetical protein
MSDSNDTPRLEVTIAAPIDQVWRALRDPELIHRWHGWHCDELAEEVRMIYLDNVKEDPEAYTLVAGGGDVFSLHPAPGGSIVRMVRAPLGTNPEWDAYYDDITEGWTTFLQQLRFGLERHGLAERQTLVLDGALAEPNATLIGSLGLAAVAEVPVGERYRATLASGDRVEGEVYARSTHQHMLSVDGLGDGLLVLAQQLPAPHRPGGGVLVVLTAYVGAAEFAEVERRWLRWWESVRVAAAQSPAPG